MPCARNRRRHRPTVFLLVPSCEAISRSFFPEALIKIILARRTRPAERERELAKPSSCSRSSESKTNADLGRPIAIGTSIVHRRCLYSEQYYDQLFMGQNTSSHLSGYPTNQELASKLASFGHVRRICKTVILS